MELCSSATSQELNDAIHSDVLPRLSVNVGRRCPEYSELSEQHQGPPATQPLGEEQQIPGRVDERMSAAQRQPSPQQYQHYAPLVPALKEALRKWLAVPFAAVGHEADPPPERDLVHILRSRIPFRLVVLVCHQHVDTWFGANDALYQALAGEKCATELWLVDAQWGLCVKKGLQQVSCSISVGIDKPMNFSTPLKVGI
ncbi:hypothetical protein Esti_006113 [Eimeria stiedai]